MPRRSSRTLFSALLLAASVAACSSGATASPAASAAASPGTIIRTDLGSTLPATAPGQRLALAHYTIPAGAKLVPHYHPGWQIAQVVAGTLSYSILTGQAEVIRGADGKQETHKAGETVILATGDRVIENPDESHFGANEGTVDVELYSATLLEDGKPVAIPLPSPSASANP
ncbi:MAG: cupin domain-containing protein [Chloroflexota bacterium]